MSLDCNRFAYSNPLPWINLLSASSIALCWTLAGINIKPVQANPPEPQQVTPIDPATAKLLALATNSRESLQEPIVQEPIVTEQSSPVAEIAQPSTVQAPVLPPSTTVLAAKLETAVEQVPDAGKAVTEDTKLNIKPSALVPREDARGEPISTTDLPTSSSHCDNLTCSRTVPLTTVVHPATNPVVAQLPAIPLTSIPLPVPQAPIPGGSNSNSTLGQLPVLPQAPNSIPVAPSYNPMGGQPGYYPQAVIIVPVSATGMMQPPGYPQMGQPMPYQQMGQQAYYPQMFMLVPVPATGMMQPAMGYPQMGQPMSYPQAVPPLPPPLVPNPGYGNYPQVGQVPYYPQVPVPPNPGYGNYPQVGQVPYYPQVPVAPNPGYGNYPQVGQVPYYPQVPVAPNPGYGNYPQVGQVPYYPQVPVAPNPGYGNYPQVGQVPYYPQVPVPPNPNIAPPAATPTTAPLNQQPLLRSTALTPPVLQLQGTYINQGDLSSARARLSALYPLTPQVQFGATLDLTSEANSFADSRGQGLNVNELYVATAPFTGLPNLRFVVGQLDLTSYFDRNSFAKDGASQFFNSVFQTNPALSATGIASRPGVLVNWTLTDNIEAKAAVFSSSKGLSDFSLDGFAGELGFRYGNAIVRGTFASNRDAGSRDGFREIFGIQRSDGSTGIQSSDREDSYGVNAEYFVPNLNMGLFARYGRYENQTLKRGGDTYSFGVSFLDVISKDDRVGLAYGRNLSNDLLRRLGKSEVPDVLELFYDFRFLPNLRLGFTLQQRNSFEDTYAGFRVKTDFDVTPRGRLTP